MWLIDAVTYKLKYIQDARQVAKKYAILSHRWEEEEVSHSDMTNQWDRLRHIRFKQSKGWYKIQKCCEQAVKDGLSYAWVDTCCIDKTSSAELQEAINSMYTWYSEAETCYVYLSDVSHVVKGNKVDPQGHLLIEQIGQSRWFKRGWTLQELIAPKKSVFFDRSWHYLGTRTEYQLVINKVTGIPLIYLSGYDRQIVGIDLCIAEVLSWAVNRETTRLEDRAYSLIGLLNITMPLLYGEGERAFPRLLEELFQKKDDQSIFSWRRLTENDTFTVALPDSPDHYFRPPDGYSWLNPADNLRRKPASISNEGINVEMHLLPWRPGIYLAIPNAILYHVGKQDRVEESIDGVLADGTVMFLSPCFPIQKLDQEGRFVRLLPQNGDDLIYIPSIRRLSARSTRLTLVSSLRRTELQLTKDVDEAKFAISPNIASQWHHCLHNDDAGLSETWSSRHNKDTHVTNNDPLLYSSTCLLVWEGWPHKLYWFLNSLPITAIAFGFEFDFEPVCVIIAGHQPPNAVVTNILHAPDTEKSLRLHQTRPAELQMAVTGGDSHIYTIGEINIYDLISNPSGYKDGTVLVRVTANPPTRLSGRGFNITLSLDTFSSERYYQGNIHISIRRRLITDPWMIDVRTEHGDTQRVIKQLAPSYKRFVASEIGRRLGTWDEQGLAGSSHASQTAESDLNDDS